MAGTIGVFVSGFFLIAVYSYLFSENRAYRYTEHIYVGFAAAHAIVIGWQNIRQQSIAPFLGGNRIQAIPLCLGLLLYARFIKRWAFLSRVSLAFMMGVASGVTITGSVEASFIKQIKATILPLTGLDNIFMVVGTVSTLAFFLFIPMGLGKKSPESDGGKGLSSGRAHVSGPGRSGMHPTLSIASLLSDLGRGTMMVAFGSSFGFVVMARLSYLVARLQFLFTAVIPVIRR